MEKTCGPGGAAPENYGDVRAFLELLKAEIAKLEGQKVVRLCNHLVPDSQWWQTESGGSRTYLKPSI
jgi:Domain of unknown function (DUF1843)